MKSIKTLAAITGAMLILTPVVALAETDDPIAVSVDPFRAEVTVEPGETSALEVTLMNDNESSVMVTVEFKEFEIALDGSTVIKDPSSEDSPANWLGFDEMSFEMAAGEEKVKDLTINVPTDTPPRGNYVAVVYTFEPVAAETDGETVIKTSTKVQSLIGIMTGENITESGTVKTEAVKDANGQVKLTTTVTNTGDIHFDPKGKVTVKNMFGGTTAEFTINGENAKVLPGGTRVYENTLDLNWAFGNYKVTTDLTAGTHGLVMSNESSFSAYSSTIWVVLGVLVVLGVVVVVLMKGGDKTTKKAE